MPELELLPINREEMAPVAPTPASVTVQLQHDVEQFYYREAELLDDWKFRDWLALLDEGVRYLMPTATNATTRDRRKSVSPPVSYVMDDGKSGLEVRVARLETGMAWAEEPPSRTRHLVTNVRIAPTEQPDLLVVRSNFLVLRCQKERDVIQYVGTRVDRLRRTSEAPSSWIVLRREIFMDQATMQTHNLTVFF
jgi:3-phenylpropionate/trans-cinnamate dioxygenase subunit beta